MDAVKVDAVEKIAAAVLYEGYLLWPYRRSAQKNQKRWTLGGVYPHDYSIACQNSDPWLMQTQCLVVGIDPVVAVRVRFLQVTQRRIGQKNAEGTLDFVDELQIGEERHLAWAEATERELLSADLKLAELSAPRQVAIDIPAGQAEELLNDASGATVGAVVRSWSALEGLIEISSKLIQPDVWQLTVHITNSTPWSSQEREITLQQTFVSTHTILTVEAGEFVSLMDTPDDLKAAAEGCENIKTWPVLAGETGDCHTLLSSPIILYDYPQIAPESGGDFYDGGEIDQMLLLNILTLTDEEKSEMRATDPRARAILERSDALTTEDFMNLHGAIREFRVLDEEFPSLGEPVAVTPLETDPFGDNPFGVVERPAPLSVVVQGVALSQGSRVRLHPHAGGDIMDIVLAGKVAVIEGIEQDYEDRIHLSVTIEDDPGQELGRQRVLGHRFFFSIEEVEPLDDVPVTSQREAEL